VHAERWVEKVDCKVLPRCLVLGRCELQCSDSELGVKQSDAIDSVRRGPSSKESYVNVPV
jgi:hypothetical protein